MFTKSDEQLIQKALQSFSGGRKKAWFTLLSRYEKMIFNYCLRMTGNQHDAMDLMQDIFISVFKGLSSYSGKGSFKSWLFKIAHFKCMDYFRRKRPECSLHETPIVEEPIALETPELNLQENQSQQQVMSLMQSLPVNQRVVLELKFFSQFTFEEIALQLGESSNTVKSRLYAALGALKHKAVELELEVVND